MAFAAFATTEAQPEAPKRKSPIALFLLLPGLAHLLGGSFPSALGWASAATTAAALVAVDGLVKHLSWRPSRYTTTRRSR